MNLIWWWHDKENFGALVATWMMCNQTVDLKDL